MSTHSTTVIGLGGRSYKVVVMTKVPQWNSALRNLVLKSR